MTSETPPPPAYDVLLAAIVATPKVHGHEAYDTLEGARAIATHLYGKSVRVPEWKPGRWWQVIAPDGSLWCETSDEEEARGFMRPGDALYRQEVTEPLSIFRRVDVTVEGPKEGP